jgi:hypothetical protein
MAPEMSSNALKRKSDDAEATLSGKQQRVEPTAVAPATPPAAPLQHRVWSGFNYNLNTYYINIIFFKSQ